MTDVQAALKQLSEPWRCGDRVKSAIDRAAKEAGIPYARAREIWYGNARRIEAHELEKIQQALHRKRNKVAKNELLELKARIARLESLLSSTDPDFHSEALAALRDCALRTD